MYDTSDGVALQAALDAHPFWYHTIDVAEGATTPGWFDLRHALDVMPFPEVAGLRCLDIGTFDGFFAFEMERRGAAEVVAIDIEDHDRWDWPPDARPGVSTAERQIGFQGPPKGDGFRLIHRLTDSKVDWRTVSIYDLSPELIGEFDVIICGTLLLHLRDPIGALEAVRSVCKGVFMSSEELQPWLTLFGRRRPLFRLNGSGEWCQWWLANAAGHNRMLFSAGFRIEKVSKAFINRFNHHPVPPLSPKRLATVALLKGMTGDGHPGTLHRAVLARPRL